MTVEARDWLVDALSFSPVPLADLRAAAEAAGFAWDTIEQVKNELPVSARGTPDGWTWELLPAWPLGIRREVYARTSPDCTHETSRQDLSIPCQACLLTHRDRLHHALEQLDGHVGRHEQAIISQVLRPPASADQQGAS